MTPPVAGLVAVSEARPRLVPGPRAFFTDRVTVSSAPEVLQNIRNGNTPLRELVLELINNLPDTLAAITSSELFLMSQMQLFTKGPIGLLLWAIYTGKTLKH